MARLPFIVFAILLGGALTPAQSAATVAAIAPGDVTCAAPLPGAGTIFEGTVLHVPDGRTLCVAQGPLPTQWVRVTLANTNAAAPRRDLMSAAFAKRAVCRVVGRTRSSVVAECNVEGVPLSDVLQRPAVRLAAFLWR